MEYFSTNVQIVGEDLLRAFCRLFYLWFVFPVIDKIHSVANTLLAVLETFSYGIIATIIPTNLIANLFTKPLFCCIETKDKNQISACWWSGNELYLFLYFLFRPSRALLQRHAKFSRQSNLIVILARIIV